jgi:hypothetical protein
MLNDTNNYIKTKFNETLGLYKKDWILCRYKNRFDFSINTEKNLIEWDGRIAAINCNYTDSIISIAGVYNNHKNKYGGRDKSYITPEIKLDDITFTNNVKLLVNWWEKKYKNVKKLLKNP